MALRRRLAAAVTAAAVALTGIVLAAPARADAGTFELGSYTYGPNSYVVIDFGTLTRDCDRFWTTSDIYVVPSGTVSEGGTLSDVSGSPNTVMGTSLGSAVLGEVIGITAPGGNIGPGTYDIVEDTCQDGVFDGSDTILRDAFEVVIPTDVPVLPDPRIQQMKSAATAQAEHWTGAAQAYALLFAGTTAYTLIRDARNLAGFYLTYVCSFLPSLSQGPVDVYCPTVGPHDLVRLQLDVVKTIVDRASYYNGIAADPPDPDFAAPSVPGPRQRFAPPTDGPLWHAVATWADHVSDVTELSAAFLGSLEKYQGAAQADDAAAALMHARDIQSYARLLNTALANESTALSSVRGGAGSGINVDTAVTQVKNALAELEQNGMSPDDERTLRNLGATPEQLTALVDELLDALAPSAVPGSFTGYVNTSNAVNNQMSQAYTDLGNAMNPIITELEQVVAGSDETPYPRVTATSVPASVAVATPRTLSVTCADCVTVEWDLDDDGAFDDATGTSISHTFTRPGRTVVGIRGTDADGRQTVAFVRTNVTTPNRPPTNGAPTPPADTVVEVPIGAEQEFIVTPTDPDGDELTTEWTVGDELVATGTAYKLAVTAADAGRAHTVVAHTTDGNGRAATTRWTAVPVHPDADGDGWHSNIDCDDEDPAVNPGRPEVPGNGVDDDCDPATPDTGPPTAAFDHVPTPAILGEAVTFTDTSTDPDGPVVDRAWDFDGDGTADADSAEATWTFATAGEHAVVLTVTDSDGNTATTTRTVTVTDRPVASFTFAPSPADAGAPVAFTDTSSDDDGIVAWEWDFDHDGVTFEVDSTEQHPRHAFDATTTVALRVTDTVGAASAVVTEEVRVVGPTTAAFSPLPETGLGDVARVEHGGRALLWSSHQGLQDASELIDTDYPSAEVGWTTASGLVTDQWAIVDLGGTWQVEAVAVQPASSTSQRPRDVRFGLSHSPSGFVDLAALELENTAQLQQVELPAPAIGRYLRYDVLNNRGNASHVRTDRLQVLSGQLGGATVEFTDRSTASTGDIVAWRWDFGDGATSTEQHPTHTYAEPGDYTVTLEVTDSAGTTAGTSLLQRVVPPLPEPTFTFPETAREADSARFTDTTVIDGRAVVHRRWQWGDGTADSTGSAAMNHVFADDGEYEVTLTVVDSLGMTASTTGTVQVENRPPTASTGGSFRSPVWELEPGVVGARWTPNASVHDASAVDRQTLRCEWDYGDGSEVVVVQPCTTTDARLPHVYRVGEYTATLTVTDKDGGVATSTAEVVAEKAATYLSVHPVPGTAGDGAVTARAKLWNTLDYRPIGGEEVTVTLGGASRTLTTDGAGEATVSLPLDTDRELSATYAGSDDYLPSSDSVEVPTRQLPPGDVVFTVDESGSMGNVQARIRENVVRIAGQLAEELDYQIGVMGFGGSVERLDGGPGYLPRILVPATDDLDDVAAAAGRLMTNGSTEPGINAVIDALGPDLGLRPGAGKCVVLVGDEPTQQYQVTPEDAAAALEAHGAILFSIITVDHRTTAYQELATDSGGAYFDIAEFADDPEPVLQALLGSCSEALVQRPDLTVSIDDGRADVSAGETLTYTVGVDNVGPVDASGVELTVTLPEGLTLASASDGGTGTDGVVTWPLFEAPAADRVVRTVTVTVDPDVVVGDTLTVTAEAFDDGTHGNDLTPANNVDSDVDGVVAAPTLTVVTEVVNDDGGTAVAGDFTVDVRDGSGVVLSLPGAADGVTSTLTAGRYTVDGGALPGYGTVMGGDCAPDGGIVLTAGGEHTCVVTHDDVAGSLTVTLEIRAVAGVALWSVPDGFMLTVDDEPATFGEPVQLPAGDHRVGVTAPDGYALDIGGACAEDGTVSLRLDEHLGCAVTATLEEPDEDPTEEPTEDPTEEPTDDPTEEPTEDPTEEPTDDPTEEPTEAPTDDPTGDPTEDSTEDPSDDPTGDSGEDSTDAPTEGPPGDPNGRPDATVRPARPGDRDGDGSSAQMPPTGGGPVAAWVTVAGLLVLLGVLARRRVRLARLPGGAEG